MEEGAFTIAADNVSGQIGELQAALDRLHAGQIVTKRNIDIFFLLINAAFIFFMQCGFAFLECGAVRSRNTTNILTKNMVDIFVAGVAYWAIGYPFAFGEGNGFIGYKFFFSGLNGQISDEDIAKWFFHFVFTATAATIVSGAVAERCTFEAYLVYSFFITALVYPVVTHWCWSEWGWLYKGIYHENTHVPYTDFAGSGVVHLLGGTCALVGASFLGPRTGRFDGKKVNSIPGHSVPLAALGGFILLLGFLAFNGGSHASISQPGDGEVVALAMMNTIISGSSAAFTGLIIVKITNKKWSLLITLNIGLAGMESTGSLVESVPVPITWPIRGKSYAFIIFSTMVAICGGCNAYYPYMACVVGIIACFFYFTISFIMEKLKVDDPLDAVAVHAGGGFWGVLAAPLFSRDGGIIYTGSRIAFKDSSNVGCVKVGGASSPFSFISSEALTIIPLNMYLARRTRRLGWNLVGALSIATWSATICVLVFGFLYLTKTLRVSTEIEHKGLDIPKHGEPAYPIEAYGHGWETGKNMLVETMDIWCHHPAMTYGSTNAKLNGVKYIDGLIWDRAFETPEVEFVRDVKRRISGDDDSITRF